MREFRPQFAHAAAADEGDGRDERVPFPRPRLRRRPRSGAVGEVEVIKGLVRDIPAFLKLLARLARDGRVSAVDKGIVLAALAYAAAPRDLIPDSIPVLGQLDDLFLLGLALDRLLNNAGIDLLLEHWEGDVGTLELALSALERVGSLLPDGIRLLLRRPIG
jgi:uncharacterized membrane protein YkvA (DUF1232 family)